MIPGGRLQRFGIIWSSCGQINTAGYSKLYNVAPWKNCRHQRSLDKHSTHRDWCDAFDDVGLHVNSTVNTLDLADAAGSNRFHTGLSLEVPSRGEGS